MQVGDRYPKEVERRQKRLQALNEAFSSGANTEIDLQRLQQTANSLHNQIQEIQERRTKQVRMCAARMRRALGVLSGRGCIVGVSG